MGIGEPDIETHQAHWPKSFVIMRHKLPECRLHNINYLSKAKAKAHYRKTSKPSQGIVEPSRNKPSEAHKVKAQAINNNDRKTLTDKPTKGNGNTQYPTKQHGNARHAKDSSMPGNTTREEEKWEAISADTKSDKKWVQC